MNLAGAAVYVTGASSGIGEAAAESFARRGARLALTARRGDRLQDLASRCEALGAPAPRIRDLDLAVPGAGAEGARWAEEVLGGMDVLVSNAGYGSRGQVWEFPPGEMERIWRVNYQAGYEAIHAVLPGMIGRRRGHVIQVSSVLGRRAIPGAAAYCVTKFAQVALAESLRLELGGSGVLASVVCPGSTRTEFRDAAADPTGRGARSLPRGRWAQSARHVGETVARVAAGRRSREVHLSVTGCLVVWANRHVPGVLDLLMRAALSRGTVRT